MWLCFLGYSGNHWSPGTRCPPADALCVAHVPGRFLLLCADRALRFLFQKLKRFQAMDSGQILHL